MGSVAFSVNEPSSAVFLTWCAFVVILEFLAIETKLRSIKNPKNQTVSCQDGAKDRGFAINRSPGLTVGMITFAMPSTLVYEETPRRGALEGLHNLCGEN